ncbi:MAG: histone deacetylase family protein [Phycisphaerae bacterium]|nr:histone deacetylase family protein [Phycisphaerae bacterium]
MLRIRRVFDDLLPIDAREIAAVQQMLRDQFPGISEEEIEGLPQKLRNPFKHKFRAFLYVCDDTQGNVRGAALISHEPELRFWFMDYLAAVTRGTGGGVGGALYGRVREEAAAGKSIGVFFECPPDEPELVSDPALLKQNIARLRFYERFGARPLIGNDYDAPLRPGQRDLPFLMYDDLDSGRRIGVEEARRIVRVILERKYGHICTPKYIAGVIASFRDDPVERRPFRYITPESEHMPSTAPKAPVRARIALVVNDKHDIHHVRERGYVEAPARIAAIRAEIDKTGLFHEVRPRDFGEKHILAVHDRGFVEYLKRACESIAPGKSVYPYVFPIRNQTRPPKELLVRAGYYCIDTFTPLNRNVIPAAKRAVDCTLTAAEELLRGERLAYALVRPPGHHAERKSFGGFCYFANAAIGAHFLTQYGKVAILDIDYHHGNGQEEIFWNRCDVLTVSIHGHPSFAYPYFSGFEEDRGGEGAEGFNVNLPLPEKIPVQRYHATLKKALAKVRAFAPRFLVVALGFDPAKGDPTGTWTLGPRDFEENGRLIGRMKIPTLIVQEGGYRTRTLGINARSFFTGLAEGQFATDDTATTRPATTKERKSAPGEGRPQ